MNSRRRVNSTVRLLPLLNASLAIQRRSSNIVTTKHPTIKFAAVLIPFGVVLFVSSCAHYRDSNKAASASPEPTLERPSPSPMDLADFYGYIKQASVTCRDLPS